MTTPTMTEDEIRRSERERIVAFMETMGEHGAAMAIRYISPTFDRPLSEDDEAKGRELAAELRRKATPSHEHEDDEGTHDDCSRCAAGDYCSLCAWYANS